MRRLVVEWQPTTSFVQPLALEKAATSNLGKTVIKDAINYMPTAYKKLKNKITSKKVKTILDTGIGDYVVNRGVDLIGEPFN